MKWTSTPSRGHCDDATLAQLLDPQADETLVQRTSVHLDHCSACQDRLTQLSATSQWWLDAGRWLEPEGAGASAPSFFETNAGVSGCPSTASDDDASHEEAYKSLALSRLREIGLLTSPAAADKNSASESLGRIGRYDVSHVIGFGGTGIVLRAVDRDLSRVVAIKVLSPELAVSGPARKRFAREGQACAAVAHENVVSIHQVEAASKVPYLVMQYIDGQSLEQYVCESGPLSPAETLRLTAQIASALSAAHAQGLVHRDVKPANVLVERGGQRVWITDFGLARAVDDASLTRTGFIAGTPHYMSPEQARGESISSSSDLFGLGSVVYFMLTGRPPFRAERTLAILNRICTQPHRPVREIIAEIPDEVEVMVDRLLAKRPADRYGCAVEVRDECLQILAQQGRPNLRRNQEPDDKTGARAGNLGFFRRHAFWLAFGAIVPLIGFGLTRSTLQSRWEFQTRRPQADSDNAKVIVVPARNAHQKVATLLDAPPRTLANSQPQSPRNLLRERFSNNLYPPVPPSASGTPLPDYVVQAQVAAPFPQRQPSTPDIPAQRPRADIQLPNLDLEKMSEEPKPTFGSLPEERVGWLYDLRALASGIGRLKQATQTPVSVFDSPVGSSGSELDRIGAFELQLQTLSSDLNYPLRYPRELSP